MHVVEWPLEVVDTPLEGVATGVWPGLSPRAGLGDGQCRGHCSYKQLHLGVNRASPHLTETTDLSGTFCAHHLFFFVAYQVESLKLFGFCSKDVYY